MADNLRVDSKMEMTAPPGKFIPVYITAKMIHAEMLVEARKDWPRLYFTARWALTAKLPTEQTKPAALWTQDNEDDIVRSRVVVGFSHPQDKKPMKDILWELGIAHAHRKAIYLAGPLERFGNYAYCSSVVGRHEKLETALERISLLADYTSHADKIMARLESLEQART